MFGEAIFEKKDDPPGVQGYHVGGLTHSQLFEGFKSESQTENNKKVRN
jgi:hypothetical protein